MAGKSSIDKFLDAVSNESINTESVINVKKMCAKAKKEIDALGNIKNISRLGKSTLMELKELIQYVEGTKYKIAKQKVPRVQKNVRDQLSKYLEVIC